MCLHDRRIIVSTIRRKDDLSMRCCGIVSRYFTQKLNDPYPFLAITVAPEYLVQISQQVE